MRAIHRRFPFTHAPPIEALTLACARTGFAGEPLDPGAEENLARLDGFPAPFLPSPLPSAASPPASFPPSPPASHQKLHALLEGITQAIREARG